MEPRPESEGDGVPVVEEEVAQDRGRSGILESSLFTLRRAIVEVATREAERVDTAVEIFVKRSASVWVQDPFWRGCV
jgi:hypothetical protein